MIPVLYVQQSSNYNSLPGFDCYDLDRDALSYKGDSAFIAHPPCRSWGRLRGLANYVPLERFLAIHAIYHVRKKGGVLEHPAGSKLWEFMSLPKPGSKPDRWGGFSVSLNQHWFGFPATKNTWLYICGCSPGQLPAMPLNFNAVTHCVSTSINMLGKKELSKNLRAKTPVQMCNYLKEICEIINENKLKKNDNTN